MDMNIKGEPGTGNSYEETHIRQTENYCPNATRVVNNHIRPVTVQINFHLTVQLNGEVTEHLFRLLKTKLNLTFGKQRSTRFDGEGHPDVPLWHLEGSPADIAEALRLIRESLGEEAVSSVCYTSKTNEFERGHLTLLQAARIAEHESRL